MPSSTTLDCRLLCASNVADEIHIKTGFKQNPCYFNPVGFLPPPPPPTPPPTIIVGGIDKIDACLVGTSKDGVILSFRGTLMPKLTWPSILDWLQDFMAIPVPIHGLPGKVHPGFYAAVKSIWNPMLAEVKKQTAGGSPLIITGHSKGAAMATLASIMLHEAGITAQTVTTFACPNTGDAEFAAAYKKLFKQTTYVNHLDLIPFMPPSPWLARQMEQIPQIGFLFKYFEKYGYHSASDHGIYIKADGSTLSQANPLSGYSLAILGDLMDIQKTAKLKGGLAKILGAHLPSCGGGYMKGVCGNTVCGSKDC